METLKTLCAIDTTVTDEYLGPDFSKMSDKTFLDYCESRSSSRSSPLPRPDCRYLTTTDRLSIPRALNGLFAPRSPRECRGAG